MNALKKNPYGKAFVACILLLFAFFAILFLCDSTGAQSFQFFRNGYDYMADYYNVCDFVAERNPYCFGLAEDPGAADHAYPPMAYLVFYFLSWSADYINLPPMQAFYSPMGMLTATLFLFFTAGLLWLLIYEAYDGRKVFKFFVSLSLFCSGTFLFSWERGNLIFLATLLSSFFVLFYDHENKVLRELSFVALALAASFKVFPALLGILLLFDRRWKDAVRLAVYGAVAFFVPFLFFKGGLANVPVLIDNVKTSTEMYASKEFPRFGFREFTQYSDFFKENDAGLSEFLGKKSLYNALNFFTYGVCILSLVTAFAQQTKWKLITQLLLIILVFPVNSARYSAMYLFVAAALFLGEKVEHNRVDCVYLLLFILIFNPLRISSALDISYVFDDWICAAAAYVMLAMLAVSSTIEAVKFIKVKQHAKKIPQAA